MKAIAALIVGISTTAAADVLTAEWQLPNWSQSSWRALREAQPLELSLRINPFVWQGDFDGDGAMDVAIMVKRIPDTKEGIVVLWRNGAAPTVLGAGTTFGHGDDFAWVDFWGVEERGSIQDSYYSSDTIKLDADGLIVSKEAATSGLIYFVDGKPKWQLQGD
jgi:hypothetical protein